MKWFKHDSNANQDAKLEKILFKFGADGYAIYWYCLELIAGKIDKNNITFELEHDSELIGNKLKVDVLRVEEIMKYMVELNLFKINEENHRITCLKLASRLDDTTSKNPEIRSILAKAKEYGKIKSTNQYVYIFKDGEKYKIGKTNNIERRFKDAKTLNTNISIFHFINTVDSYLLETKLHNYFNHKRIDGEWFVLDNEDLKFICEINKIDDVPSVNKFTPNGSEQTRLEENRVDKKRIEDIEYTNKFFSVTKEQHTIYLKAYPHINLTHQYNLMESWLISNPTKQKKSYPRFINNWLGKCKVEPKDEGLAGYGKWEDEV